MADERRIETYSEFWPYYLREHSRPATRNIHCAGTAVSLVALAALFVSGSLWFLPVALAGGYGPAWVAHFWIEGNRPATFRHPLWSLFSDFRMAVGWATGQLDSELTKAGIDPR